MKENLRLKISHIDFGFNWPAAGGEQIRVCRVTRKLLEMNFDIELIVPSFRRKEIVNFDMYPVKYFYCQNLFSKRQKIFPLERKVIRSIYRCLEEMRPDIIHYHFGTMKYIINAIRAGNLYNVPSVVTMHQFWPLCYRGIYFDFEENVCSDRRICGECMLTIPFFSKMLGLKWRKTVKNILNSVDHFIVYSEFMKQKLMIEGIDDNELTVIPFGVDFDNIQAENGIREYVVFSGRLSREKGVDLFLHAISKVKNAKFEVIVIGDGPQRKEYEEMATKLRVDAQFMGWINDRKKYFHYLKKAICVVVPSVWIENSPLVIGEAFACETPVIGTNSGGIPELIDNSGAGFVVERDPDEIAEKIQLLVDDRKLRDEMGRKGRVFAEKHFNWERNVARIAEIYESLVSRK